MKQIVFIFMAILLATGMASAQKKAVISAETTSFDFGTIKEEKISVDDLRDLIRQIESQTEKR